MPYARTTEVPIPRTQSDIQQVITKYGADAYGLATDSKEGRASVTFRITERYVRIDLPLPPIEDYRVSDRGQVRTIESQRREWDQACRSRWRALLLVIRAKLEAIEIGISTIEREFLADVVLPNGATVGEWAVPQVQTAYLTGKMPTLLAERAS